MKIGQSFFQPNVPKQETKEQSSNKETNFLQQFEDSKQAIKEAVQRQIAEIQEARTDMGEDDPKAQRLIEKFKNGKKLTPEEMAYIRRNAPGMVDYIDRIMREREIIELSMKLAPTKTDVQMVAFRASKQIEKHPNPEEREIRAKHLADAKHEYEQTDEYKAKPNSPLEKEENTTQLKWNKPKKPYKHLALNVYEDIKQAKKESSINVQQ